MASFRRSSQPPSQPAGALPGRVRIGTAGWSIPARSRVLFGEGASVLARYATLFDAVEINSSFYRPHQARTYARWAASVPADFRFSVKMPRAISHDLRLVGVGTLLDRFLGEADALDATLGGFLLQLPPSLAMDKRTATNFLRMFRGRSRARLACEPRHPSWFTREAVDVLHAFGATLVAADPPPVEGIPPSQVADWHYWRWHGSPEMYYSDYPEPRLRALAGAVVAAGDDREAWIVFDNTARGHATANAARLRELLAVPSRPGESTDA